MCGKLWIFNSVCFLQVQSFNMSLLVNMAVGVTIPVSVSLFVLCKTSGFIVVVVVVVCSCVA